MADRLKDEVIQQVKEVVSDRLGGHFRIDGLSHEVVVDDIARSSVMLKVKPADGAARFFVVKVSESL